MSRLTVRRVARWAALMWLGSLVLAVVVLVPALLSVRSAVADTRALVASHKYSSALEVAGGLPLRGAVCQLALKLPAPLTLRLVPAMGANMQALDQGCGLMQDLGPILESAAVQALADHLGSAPSLREMAVDKTLVQLGLRALDELAPSVRKVLVRVRTLDALGLPGSVGSDIHRLAAKFTSGQFEDVRSLASVAPALLGLDKPRTYFVALESNAEMRATGGFLGQYAIVRVSSGAVRVLRVGPNTELVKPAAPGVHLLAGTEAITLTDNPMWVNTNLSPHGPDVGALWLYGWEQQTGVALDGAIGIDITTAARLAAAAGGTISTPAGAVLSSAAEISDYAQNGVYFDFDGPGMSGDPRKSYQLGVLRELLQHASASILNVDSLLNVLPSAIAERRVLLRFADPAWQARIVASPVAQDTTVGEPGSVLVSWNNWAGNKFDYYMRAVPSARCASGGGVDMRLDVASAAEAGRTYPAYIGQRLDTPSEKRASVRDQFLFVLPKGAAVRALSVDGRVANYQVNALGDRPVVQLILDTVAGQTHVVRLGLGGVRVTGVRAYGSQTLPVVCST